ncbi:restriction endonuclease subunit S [Lactobacillus acidophilus]
MKRKLGDLAIIVKSKDSVEKIDRNKYVTTENMISNRGGVSFPSSTVPKQNKLDTFDKDDVLVSNIRPYFKKIWKAPFGGYKSGDVLAFRTKDRDILSQEYLYILLESDRFFEYMTTTAKGTKMPRGDKKAIAEFPFDLPSIDIQKKRSHQIEVIEQKISLNQQINANLFRYGLLSITHLIEEKHIKKIKISDLDLIVSDHVANGSFKALKQNVNYFDSKNYALFLRNVDFKKNLNGNLKYIDKSSYNFLKKSHLFGGEVVISNVADVGSVHRVPHFNTHMVVGNNQIFLKSKDYRLTDYLYLYFKSRYGQHDIETITSGSAQQKFNKTDFRSLRIPIINLTIVKEQFSPILKEIDSLKLENKILNNLKSELLSHLF